MEKKNDIKNALLIPRIETGSSGWKPDILTTDGEIKRDDIWVFNIGLVHLKQSS